MDTINISLGDFLKNVGISGLNYLLEMSGAQRDYDYGISADNQSFWLNRDFAVQADWTDMYFKAFVECYGDNTAYKQVMDKIHIILNAAGKEDWDAGKFKDDLKFINDKLLSNSYKSGFKNIEDKISNSEVYERLEKNKLKPDMGSELVVRLSELETFLSQPLCRETFCMKSIIYNIINRFWDGKSFLLRANAAKDMREMFEKDFSAPLKNYIAADHSKAKDMCIECGNRIDNSEKVSIAFMTERADDLARKRSAFWDCKVDAFLCPVCAFLYSLVPLGFRLMGNSFMFINTNAAVSVLLRNNSKDKDFGEQKEIDEKYSQWIARTINILLENDTKRLENVQIIIRGSKDNDRYFFNVISKDVLELLKDTTVMGVLNSLAEQPYVKTNNDYWNVHEEAVINILQYRSQYAAINKLLKLSLEQSENGNVFKKAEQLYRIELKAVVKRIGYITGGKLMDIDEAKRIKNKGYELRRALLDAKGTNDDSCLRGMVYQLLNALSVNNCQRFMDIIMRVYCSTKLQIPDTLIKLICDAEVFQTYGYAFVLGIQGSHFEKIGGVSNE